MEWLAYEAHITTIRLPIGYFTLGSAFTHGTPFASPISSVYTHAWPAVLNLCSRLHAVGIAILLDLHALPGGANTQDHSGTSTGRADLWGNSHNLELAKRCLVFMAGEVASGGIRGCVGIQLCNEACWGAGDRGMWAWYEDVVRAVGEVDVSVPLWISDAWDLRGAVGWCGGMNKYMEEKGKGNPVGVAVPRYFTFTEEDKEQSPREIIERVSGEFGDVQAAGGSVVDKGAVQVLVGEWSCAMSGESWGKARGEDREELVRRFGQVQSEQWMKRAGGAFFWTAKMEWMDGGEWGVWEMVRKGAVVPPENLMLEFEEVRGRVRTARGLRDGKRRDAVDSHVAYWERTAPGGCFEHWRFEQGWDLGFADALAFYEMRANGAIEGARNRADMIGSLELWMLKRLRDSGQSGDFAWEYEHGFRQGVSAFEESMRW